MLTGRQERLAQRIFFLHICKMGNMQQSGRAVPLIRTTRIILGPHEIGQHLRPAPSRIAGSSPAVIILGLPADVKKAVEGAAAADHLAAGIGKAAAAAILDFLRLVRPQQARIVQRIGIGSGHGDRPVIVIGACLQQQHPVPGIGGQ